MEPVDRVIRVHYPRTDGLMRLRTERDWERDVEPLSVERDGTCHVFRVRLTHPFLYFKPVLRRGDGVRWSAGPNFLVVAAFEDVAREVYPYFEPAVSCTTLDLHELPAPDGGPPFSFRVYLPPGYGENTTHRYPVAYMQDGQNLFFPDESFQRETWRVRETVARLTEMNQTSEMIVVGVQPRDRMVDYTKPGYEAYARFLVEVLKPRIDAEVRTHPEAASTAVMGSSLGGVVSLYLAWQHPTVFGMAACLSSTFGYRDDLRDRVAEEPRRDLRLYLDSGYPSDNFEVTRQLAALLLERGWTYGRDLLYLAFPEASHREAAWATRLHIPFQFLFGVTRGRWSAAPAAAPAAPPGSGVTATEAPAPPAAPAAAPSAPARASKRPRPPKR